MSNFRFIYKVKIIGGEGGVDYKDVVQRELLEKAIQYVNFAFASNNLTCCAAAWPSVNFGFFDCRPR